MAKGRPRKREDEGFLDLSYLLCYLNLLTSPLKAIRNWKEKMQRVCQEEQDYIWPVAEAEDLDCFCAWINSLHSNTCERIFVPIGQKETGDGLRRLILHQELALSASDSNANLQHAFMKRGDFIERCAQSGHAGDLYAVQLALHTGNQSQEQVNKFVDMRQQYQEILLSIFDSLKQDLEPPPTASRSLLPFPDQFSASMVEALAEMRSSIDCLGRTLSHYLLDIVGQYDWRTSWQSMLTKTLDLTPDLLDSRDLFGRTALYTACENGQYKAVVELLARKADLEIPTSLGLTPLHIAAASGRTSNCNLLLRNKSVSNSQDEVNGWTPLCYAARHGHYDVVQLLLDHEGVDVNHQDLCELTPFHLAALGRHLGVMKLLGGRDKVVHDTRDEDGHSVLHLAVDEQFLDGFNYLLEILRLDPNCKDHDGETPLIVAVDRGVVDIVEMLLKDPRTRLFTSDNDGNDAFERTACPEVRHLLEATLEARWRPDFDIMVENVLECPGIQTWLISGHTRSDVSSRLEDLDFFVTRSIMREFEERDVSGWAASDAYDWTWARSAFEYDFLAYLEHYYR